jgi:hypothetical protein
VYRSGIWVVLVGSWGRLILCYMGCHQSVVPQLTGDKLRELCVTVEITSFGADIGSK